MATNMVESIPVRVLSKSASPPSPSSSSSSSSSPPPPPLNRRKSNFERSGPPSRLLYFGSDGTWRDFPAEICGELRSAFSERKPIADLSIGGVRYLFDLLRMLQIDFDSGNQRSIAWIDNNNNCFFPHIFIGEEFEENDDDDDDNNNNNTTKIEIEIKIDENSLKRKREEKSNEEEPEVSSLKKDNAVVVPKRQRLGVEKSTRLPNVRLLKENEKSYAVFRNNFVNGMKLVDPAGIALTAIHLCTHEGHLEKARLEVFKKQFEITKAARGGVSRTVYAWYGAGAKEVENALAHGFIASKGCFGVGVYLSPLELPHLSAKMAVADDNGEKHLVLCRVILGNVEKVEAGSQQCHPSSVDFDTGVDDTKNPKRYIVWSSNMNRHIIPVSVFSFKSSNNPVQGQVRGSTPTKYSMEFLFAKLRSSLSPTQIQEAEALEKLLRGGKLARDMFIRQMRRITGDNVLMSIIREIHASE